MRDLRLAFRSLRRAPGFVAAAVLTLALGIGVTTAGFSLINALLLRPLPGIVDGGRLAVVQFDDTVLGGSQRSVAVSPAQLRDLTEGLSAVTGLASYVGSVMNVGTTDTAVQVRMEYIMPRYFALLGTRPALGRLLTDEDDRAGAPQVAVIGHDLWATLYHRDPAVIGKRLRISTETFTVVGVTPMGFGGISGPRAAGLWIPSETFVSTVRVFSDVINWTPFLRHYQFVMRPASGASLERAEAELAARGQHVLGKRLRSIRGAGLPSFWRERTVDTLRLIMGVTGVVLLLACANVAGLVLVRGLHRWGEAAMRKVLGASIADLARRQLIESLVLAAGGTLLGLGIATLAVRAFRGAVLVRGLAPLDAIPLDARVALFAAGAAVVAAVIAGLAPLSLVAQVTAMDAIRGAARAITRPGRRLRQAFTVLQFAVSLALLAGAALLFRTLRTLAGVELGFDPNGVAMVEVQPARRGYQGARLEAYYIDLLDRLRAEPGIESVALASFVPFSGNSVFQEVSHHAADGATASSWAALSTVSPDYFRVLRVPMVRGRSFTGAEFVARSKERPPVVVINQALAGRLFGDANPVGKLVVGNPDPRPFEVVGVVAESRWNTLGEVRQAWEGGPHVYRLYHTTTSPGGQVIVRSREPSGRLLATVQRVAAALDRSVPVANARMLEDNIAEYLAPRRLLFKVLTWLAVLGLAIAAVGLYGVVAYGVTSRTRELGIRMALGARSGRVLTSVLREGCGLAALGVVAGVLPALILGRVLASSLVGVSALDPAALLAAAGTLFATALLASWIPARRAAGLQPASALRLDAN